MIPVTCVGALHVDAKARLHGPLVAGSSNPVSVTRTPGGVACNVARSLARLGIPVALVSVVGDDDAGRGLCDRLAAEGVDVSTVAPITGATTGGYTAVLDGDRALAFGLADMAIYQHLDEVRLAPVVADRGDLGLWFVDANLPASGMAALRGVVAPLALDPVSVAKAPSILPLLDGAAVFPDAAEATALTGHENPADAARALTALGARLAVVTCGADGIWVADADSAVHRPAAPHGPVADVTGAGDALVAGYLAAMCLGEPDALGWGLAAASIALESLATVSDDLSVTALRDRL